MVLSRPQLASVLPSGENETPRTDPSCPLSFRASGSPARESRTPTARNGKIICAMAEEKMEAERAGFEPAVGCYPYNGLASRRDRPLCHLSGARILGRAKSTLLN